MTTLITFGLLSSALPALKEGASAPYLKLINGVCADFDIVADVDKVHFLANITHECADFNSMQEGAIYSSPDQIKKIFPRYFKKPDGTWDEALVTKYTRNREILSYVYANRMGNGPVESGDGYRYRGRCPIMATGKKLYTELSASGHDYVSDPDSLTNPVHGMNAAGYFWKSRKISVLASQDKLRETRIAVNGGTIGLPDVEDRVRRLKVAFGITPK